jgi:hypothetical protein
MSDSPQQRAAVKIDAVRAARAAEEAIEEALARLLLARRHRQLEDQAPGPAQQTREAQRKREK